MTSDNSVVNKSNKTLTQTQLQVLSRGLQFCPTPQSVNNSNIIAAGLSYGRRLRLLEYFHNSVRLDNANSSNTLNVTDSVTPVSAYSQNIQGFFQPTSTFCPSSNRDKALDTYVTTILRDLSQLHITNPQNNLSCNELQALKELRADQSIIIKPADKGGATVILNRADYEAEAYRQLNNNQDYCRIPVDPTTRYVSEINKVLKSGIGVMGVSKGADLAMQIATVCPKV